MDALWIALLALALAATAAVLGIASFIVLSFGRFLAYLRFKGSPAASTGELFAGVLSETSAFLRIGAWRTRPGRAGTDRPAPSHLEGRPVLFVHGYWGAAPDFRGLRRAVERTGRPTYAVGLGALHAPIESSARVLTEHLVRLVDRYRERDGLDIVAHSMGGLVVRRALMDHPELGARVKTFITLGTPHAGTAHARGYVVGANVQQMRRRAAFLEELSPVASCCPTARVVTVSASLDAIVYPHDSCHLSGSEQVTLSGIGHAGLLVDRRAVDAVLSALSEERLP